MKLNPIAAALALTLTAIAGHADEPLEKITVTSATKTERTVENSPVSVDIVDEQQIQAIGAQTLGDILLHMPGVFINPDRRGFSIRGASVKGTLLLIDGRRIATEFTNNYDANRIPAGSIERIEIVKGPMGALYGSDALGGVINIITKRPTETSEGSFSVSGAGSAEGKSGQLQVEGDVRGRKGATGYSAWFSAQKQNEYAEQETANIRVPQGGVPTAPSALPGGNPLRTANSGLLDQYHTDVSYREPSEIFNVGGQLAHQLNEQVELRTQLSFMTEQRHPAGIAGAYESNYIGGGGTAIPVQNTPYEQKLNNERLDLGVGAKIKLTQRLDIDWQTSFSNYTKKDEITTPLWQELGYASKGDSASLTGDGKVYIQQHNINSTWQPNQQHRVLVGAEYFEDKRDAAFFASDGKMTTKTLDNSAVFAQHEWQLSAPWAVVYGLRYDQTKSAGDATTANIGTSYQFQPMLNLRARYAQGFRSPDSQEMYINRYNPQGKRFVGADVVDASINKTAFELDAERSQNLELGLSGRNQAWHYDLAIYQNEITDNILRDNTANYISFRNASEVTIKGLEARLGTKLSAATQVNFALNLMDSKDKDTQKRLEYTPDLTASVGLNHQLSSALTMRVDVQYIGDQLYSETVQNITTYKTAKAYTPVNINVNYSPSQWGQTEIYGGIDNLLDTQVDKVLGSDPGPVVRAGVRMFF